MGFDIRRRLRALRHHLSPPREGPVPCEVVRPAAPPATWPGTGLVVTTFDRPEVLERSLASLGASALEGAVLAIVDDASADPRTRRLIDGFAPPGVPVFRVYKQERRGFGVHESLRIGWDLLRGECGCARLANLDGDTLVKPDWLARLGSLFERERARRGPLIATGFHAGSHGVLEEGPDLRVKASVGGINLYFDAALYDEVVRPNLRWDPVREVGWDWHVVGAMRARGLPLLCTRPSVVQHIGLVGRFSGPRAGCDVAPDFT